MVFQGKLTLFFNKFSSSIWAKVSAAVGVQLIQMSRQTILAASFICIEEQPKSKSIPSMHAEVVQQFGKLLKLLFKILLISPLYFSF
jgi:hypothetical protein